MTVAVRINCNAANVWQNMSCSSQDHRRNSRFKTVEADSGHSVSCWLDAVNQLHKEVNIFLIHKRLK